MPEAIATEIKTRPEPDPVLMDSLVSVTLTSPESFLYVKEVLTRIGIKAKNEPRLCQSCHILKKRDKHYIMHFKELFLLDGKTANFSDDDVVRRNMVAKLLQQWGLVTIDDPKKVEATSDPLPVLDIISHKDKKNYILESKYQIGKKGKYDSRN